MDESKNYMALALAEAKKAAARDEVPVGAVLVHAPSGRVLARDGNRTRAQNDPSAHAEMLVIRAACAEERAQRLPEYDLYVTLEPCAMCAAAISFARIRVLHYAAPDEKGGAVAHGPQFFTQPTCHHRPEINAGALAEPCSRILRDFFATKRRLKND